jgi:Sigma-70, region 4
VRLPDPIVEPTDGTDPELQALLADSVGLALLVVLDTLSPAERLAFVLHDMFGLSFDEIAPVVDRSPATATQLASRARRRVRGAAPVPDADMARQREVAEAYLAASRKGDFEGLLAVLDPDVVLRADFGAASPGVPRLVRGALAVTRQALLFSRRGASARLAVVNGSIGAVVFQDGNLAAVVGFTIAHTKIVEMNILADPDRLGRLGIGSDA